MKKDALKNFQWKMIKIFISYQIFTQENGKITYAETKRADWVLTKSKTCVYLKSEFYKSKFSNIQMS